MLVSAFVQLVRPKVRDLGQHSSYANRMWFEAPALPVFGCDAMCPATAIDIDRAERKTPQNGLVGGGLVVGWLIWWLTGEQVNRRTGEQVNK